MKKIVILFSLILFIISCDDKNTALEKYPDFSKNVVDVSKKIIPIKTEVLLGPGKIKKIGSYLMFNDWYADDGKGFVFFDTKTLKHIGYGGKKGQGPGELIKYRNARIIPNERETNSFFVFDYSRLFLYKYSIDSLLSNKNYLPERVLERSVSEVLGNIVQLNDSTFLGMSLYTTSVSSFMQRIVKLNVNSGKTKAFGYLNPHIKELGKGSTHSAFAISLKKNVYIQAFFNEDLITFCNSEGNLICNVYGKMWKKEDSKKLRFYSSSVAMTSKYFFVDYAGSKRIVLDKHKRPRGAFPQKIRIFDFQGNYIKTLDFREELRDFCIDEETNRIFISFLERDEPLAYLDLNEILR